MDRPIAELDRLAKPVYRALVAANAKSDALRLASYPFLTACCETQLHPDDRRQKSAADASDFKGRGDHSERDTQRYVALRSEIAMHLGNALKIYLEQMLELLAGFTDLGEQRLQLARAGKEICLLALNRVVMVQRR